MAATVRQPVDTSIMQDHVQSYSRLYSPERHLQTTDNNDIFGDDDDNHVLDDDEILKWPTEIWLMQGNYVLLSFVSPQAAQAMAKTIAWAAFGFSGSEK